MNEFHLHTDGLWLPEGYGQQVEPTTRGSLDSMGVTMSYSQIYGSVPTWSDFKLAISEYSLENIIDVVSRISICLYKNRTPFDPEIQHMLCKGIFGNEGTAHILATAQRVDREMRQEGEGAPGEP